MNKLPREGETIEAYLARVVPLVCKERNVTEEVATNAAEDYFNTFHKNKGKVKPSLILQTIAKTQWAILPSALETILAVAKRENEEIKFEALLAREGKALDSTQSVIVRGNAAILPINGPIFARANLMTELSGATSTEVLIKDFTAALDDPSIENIILDIDSEGGDVNGISDLADTIFNARGKKNVISFIRGIGASAAFWIASASQKIFLSKTAIVGSIGVMTTFIDDSKAKEEAGIEEIEIISSNAPNKNLPPTTNKGKAQLQTLVDNLETIFIDTVARNRGITSQEVIEKFGQGGVFVGQEAVDRGMADGIDILENIITSLNPVSTGDTANNNVDSLNINFNAGANKMDGIEKLTLEDLKAGNEKLFNDILALGREEGIKIENTRLKNIEKLITAANADVVNNVKFDTSKTDGDIAIAIVEADQKKAKAIEGAITEDAGNLADAAKKIEENTSDEETKAEEKKKALANIVAGGNSSRKKNVSWGDKLKFK